MLGINLVNSSDAFNALVAETSAIIAIAKYKYVIFSLCIIAALTREHRRSLRVLAP